MPSLPFDATPLLRAHARLRIARLLRQDAAAAQEALLRRLVARAAPTRFGRAHGFGAIRDVAGFQLRVPLRRPEELWARWWRTPWPVLSDVTWPGLVPCFSLSTALLSGRTQRLPVTRALLRAQRGAVLDALCWHLHHNPRSRILGGPGFALLGSTALEELAEGVQEGEPAGLVAAAVPRPLRRWIWPPSALASMGEWAGKLDLLARALPAEALCLLAGRPERILPLLELLAERRGTPLPLPALELLLLMPGAGQNPLLARLRPFLPPRCATRELLATDAGVLAVADHDPGEGLRLLADRGAFLEFVPVGELDTPAPRRHWAATIEPGVDYALVVSSCAGLWACLTGETLQFLERSPPRLVVTGRLGARLSAFGERLRAEEIEAALALASLHLGLKVAAYCVGPLTAGPSAAHLWLVEVEQAAEEIGLASQLAVALDTALAAASADYAAQRRAARLDVPKVELLPPGAFAGWLHAEGRPAALLAEVPRVVTDPQRFAQMAAALLP